MRSCSQVYLILRLLTIPLYFCPRMHTKCCNTSRYLQADFRIKPVISYFVFVVIAFAFFLQQLSAFTFVKEKPLSGEKSITRILYNEQGSSAAHISATIPLQSLPTETDLEFEIAEEEETKNSFTDYGAESAEKYVLNEINFTSFLRIRFLQIASSVENQPVLPLFILHHSWKNYLS